MRAGLMLFGAANVDDHLSRGSFGVGLVVRSLFTLAAASALGAEIRQYLRKERSGG